MFGHKILMGFRDKGNASGGPVGTKRVLRTYVRAWNADLFRFLDLYHLGVVNHDFHRSILDGFNSIHDMLFNHFRAPGSIFMDHVTSS